MTEPNTETTQTEATPDNNAPATREELLQVAKEAFDNPGEVKVYDESAEVAAAVEGAIGGESDKQPEAPAEEEPNWKRILSAREKAHAEREAARTYAEEAKKRAEAEAQEIINTAKRQAAEEVAKEKERWAQRYATDPDGALRELGTSEEIAGRLTLMSTPEGKTIADLQRKLAETAKEAAAVKDVKKEFEEFKKQQALEVQRERYESAKNTFLTAHATKDKSPYLHARYDIDEIVTRANKVADDWSQAGVQFDLADIAAYLEHEAKEKLTALGLQPAKQVPAGTSGKVASQVSANGSRTITNAAASERRAAPKPLAEMTEAEQRADLLDVARKAWKAHGGR